MAKQKIKQYFLFAFATIFTILAAVAVGRLIGVSLISRKPLKEPKIEIATQDYDLLTKPETLDDFLKEEQDAPQAGEAEPNEPDRASDEVQPKTLTPVETTPLSLTVQKVEPKPQEEKKELKTKKTYILQVGSFQKEENAKSFAEELRELDYAPYMEKIENQDQTLYKVFLGRKLSKEEVENLKEELEALGYQAIVIPQKEE